MSIEKRVALLTTDGQTLFPYKKKQASTGRYGFAASTPEHGSDRKGGGYYTEDVDEMVRGLLFKGWGVRAKSESNNGVVREGSYKLGERAIRGYWLAPELRHLAVGAAIPPATDHPALPTHSSASENRPDLEAIETKSVEDYLAAFERVLPSATRQQKAMLIGHASAPNASLSMSEIARLAGYTSFSGATLHYGKLGRSVADALGLPTQRYWTNVLCMDGPRDEKGHWQWQLRPKVIDALDRMGMVERPSEAALSAVEAAQELDNEVGAGDRLETERQALINARIGQGGYRKRMLTLWGGRCAVTGCAIETVLIASHAIPWKDSTDTERLDAHNGLLLNASLDRLFDAGLIAFADDGRILVKPSLAPTDLSALGLSADTGLRFVRDRHLPYLRRHREVNGF